MDTTTRLMMVALAPQSVEPPSQADVLLRQLVASLGVLAEDAAVVGEREELPRVLRRIVRMAEHMGKSWACWSNGEGRCWLFVADLSTGAMPILQIDYYSEDGELRDSGAWVVGREGRWQRWSA